jgi:hypothetical protein
MHRYQAGEMLAAGRWAVFSVKNTLILPGHFHIVTDETPFRNRVSAASSYQPPSRVARSILTHDGWIGT